MNERSTYLEAIDSLLPFTSMNIIRTIVFAKFIDLSRLYVGNQI